MFQHIQSSRDFWHAYRKCAAADRPISSLIRPDGGFAVSAEQKAQVLSDSYAASFNTHDCEPVSFDPDPAVPVIPEWRCTSAFVLEQIRNFSISTPTGLDAIPVRLLRACSGRVAGPIAEILNRSLADGNFPDQWKQARITALPKKQASSQPTDFRPISILPIMSKIAERWMLSLISPLVVLSPFQFAYTRGRSTEDAVAFLQLVVTQGFEQCKGSTTKVAAVSIDVAKAFDSIPKHALLNQLERQWNVPTAILCLLKSYLSNRTQTVRVEHAYSAPAEVRSGVPQGSVLGGFLFAAYINSILKLPLSKGAVMIMYADDLLLLKPIPSAAVEAELQTDLDLIQAAYTDLFLSINPLKSQMLIFSLSPSDPLLAAVPTIAGFPILRVDSLVYLGFHLDHHLTFNSHAAQAVSKGKKAIGCLYRTFGKVANPGVFQRLVQAKVLPIFLYGSAVAMPTSKSALAVLEKLNRFAARLILNNYSTDYHQLLWDLSWKDISRITFERHACLAFKYVHSFRHLPGEFVRMTVNPFRHSQRTLNQPPHNQQLYIPSFTKASCQKAPIYQLFQVWNALPSDVVETESFVVFKSLVRSPVVYSMVQSRVPDGVVLFDTL